MKKDQLLPKVPELKATEIASNHAMQYLQSCLRTIADYPKPGIAFKDITPLLANPQAFAVALDLMAQPFVGSKMDHVVAMEARGFIFGGALAARLGIGFVPVRKPGKLPGDTDEVAYALEYGEERLQMHIGSLQNGDAVLIVDDVLATGGTAAATAALVQKQGAVVAGAVFLIELDFLAGRNKLLQSIGDDTPVHAVLHDQGE